MAKITKTRTSSPELDLITQQLYEIKGAADKIELARQMARKMLVKEAKLRGFTDKAILEWVKKCVGDIDMYRVGQEVLFKECPTAVASNMVDKVLSEKE